MRHGSQPTANRPPHLVASYDTQGGAEDVFYPDVPTGGTTMKETIRVKVVDVVPVYNYKKKDNTTHSMFAADIADEKTAAKLLVYDVSKAATMKAGTSWFLMDFVVREG